MRVWPLAALLAALLPLGTARGASRGSVELQQEVDLLHRLEQIGGQVVALEQTLEDLQHEQRQLSYQTGEAQRRIAALERRAAERRGQLKRRVRALYKLSRGGLVRLVLDGARGGELYQRVAAARLILRRDMRELTLYRQERRGLVQQRRQLQRKLASARRVEAQLRQHGTELERARAEQRQLLRRLQRSRGARGAVARQLDAQQRKLVRQINELTYRVRTAGGLAARRGRLPRPVAGPVVGVFGKRRLQGRRGVEVLRHGITIRPYSRRARVQAVAAGTVRLAGPLAGYGRVVLVEHGGGYFTLYGYLSAVLVKEGQRLQQGTTVGRAGDDPLTGERATYFEVRRGERPLDPAVWIRR